MSALPASIKRIGNKTTGKSWRHRFPYYKTKGLSVAMESRVLIQSAPKPYAALPLPQLYYTHKLITIGQLASEIFKFESLDEYGRRTDNGSLI